MEQLPQKQSTSSQTFSIVKASEGIKIREIDGVEQIKQQLRQCFVLVGLTNIPEDELKDYLIEYIVTNYGGLNPLEISHAFSLAVQGKFKVDLKHFNNFSPEYFSRIMIGYNLYRANILARKPKPLQQPKPKEWDRLLYYQDQLFKKYDKIKEKERYYLFNEIDERYLYRSLDALGVTLATTEDKNKMMKESEEGLTEKYRETPHDRQQRVKDKAISMCFQNWIMKMVSEDVDIRELIKNLIK